MKQSILLSALLFLCLIAAAPGAKNAASHDVAIKGMKFDPAQIEIAGGDTGVWKHADDRDHTVVATDNSFKSGNHSKGHKLEQTSTKYGKYNYARAYHP